MLIWQNEQLTTVQVGEDAVQAYIKTTAQRREINCVGLRDYCAARQAATPAQRAQLDAVVSAKLAHGVATLALPARTWYQKRARQITRNWLAGFAQSTDVPAAVRAVAAQGGMYE
ncbi:hypothetical protein [Lacticaseibacillus daqingensis]|uniref:hypothetical protein n=1 Tax=Lacticaseibacillus daqingensis TaxID=2486014 RepID=UPI000F7886CB|nr:hypothetical protein [Lacticaseibacillus daqingensis]